MTATFTPDLSNAISRIRQRIGDTVPSTALVQDETITAYLTTQGLTELRTASRLCRDIAASFARVGDINLDNQLSKVSKIYDHYIALAEEIEAEEIAASPGQVAAGRAYGRIIVGGLTDTRRAFCGWDLP